MTIDTGKLKLSTKSLVSFVLTFGGLMQIPQFGNIVMALAKGHPHITIAVASLSSAAMLLHNPQVEQLLGIKQTVETKTEEVTLKDPQ